MSEEERRREVLAAEAAIRELALRMAEASGCAKQAEATRSTLEVALRSLEGINIELRALIGSEKNVAEEEGRSLSQLRETLDLSTIRLQKAQKDLENEADLLGTSLDKRAQKTHEVVEAKLNGIVTEINNALERFNKRADLFEVVLQEQAKDIQESVDARLDNLLREINEAQKQLSARSDGLESLISETDQRSWRQVGAKVDSLLNNIDILSSKLLFVMDQNEASNRSVIALEQSIKGLSGELQDIKSQIEGSCDEINLLKMGIVEFNGRLSSLEQVAAAKTTGFSYRLRSALIGGIGMVMAFVVLKFV